MDSVFKSWVFSHTTALLSHTDVYMLLSFLHRGQNRSKHRLGCVEKHKGSFILIELIGTSDQYERAEHWVLLKSQEKATENRTDITIWRSVKGGEKTHTKAAPLQGVTLRLDCRSEEHWMWRALASAKSYSLQPQQDFRLSSWKSQFPFLSDLPGSGYS